MQSNQYTTRHLKGDVGVGMASGAIFGTVYSFYYWHVEKSTFKFLGKNRSSAMLYFATNAFKMGAGWALMRTTWNCGKK